MGWTKESLDKTSEHAFGLADRAGVLVAGWMHKPSGGDKHAKLSVSAGGTKHNVGIDTSKGPSLAASGETVHLLCRDGVNDTSHDKPIQHAWSGDLSTWKHETLSVEGVSASQQPQTDKAVGACMLGSTLVAAFKRDSHHIIGIATLDTAAKKPAWAMSSVTVGDTVCAGAIANPQVDGAPVVDHFKIKTFGDHVVVTNEAPALASDGERVYLAFGMHGGRNVYLGWTTDPTSGAGWTFQQVPGARASKHMAPGVAAFGGQVIVAWYDDDKKVWTSAYTPGDKTWGEPVAAMIGTEQIQIDSGPLVLGVSGGSLYLSYPATSSAGPKARLASTTATG